MNPHETPNIFKNAELKKHPFARASVDIIIPFHAQYDRVVKLIQSIIQSVQSNPYQITLVDDGSPNANFITQFKDFDKERPKWALPLLNTIRNKERLGFAKSLKVGFDNTKQPWVMIMHSDCVVEDPQWMIEMGRSLLLLKDKNIKMIGPRSDKKNIGKRANDLILDGEALPLFCAMFHRELFSHIGGFIKDYPGYEDEELAHRMNYYGYKQAICANSFIRHIGGGTYGPLIKENPELQKQIDSNRELVISDLQKLFKS